MKNPKVISGICTATIMAIIVAVLLAFGYNPPDPPIPEEGVEVNLGNSDLGFGQSADPVSEASSYAPPAAQEQVATQHTEPAPAINAAKKTGVTNPNATEQPKVENKEPQINPNALFTGRRNQNSGNGSQGQSTGTGDQGKPDGTPNSNNYVGSGGNGGNYSLAGRSAVSLPLPQYNSNQQGTVVVRIWVDQQGRVTRAEYEPRGSNTSDGNLVSKAKAAALKARFNADRSAQEEQRGTITYIFKI